MTQLRTSAHTLAIEYGRYTRPKIQLEDRYGLFCPHILEDEKHFWSNVLWIKPKRTFCSRRSNTYFKLSATSIKKKNSFSFWTVKTSRYLPGLVNLYITHLKQEMKSWYNFVTGYNSLSSADKYLLLISIYAWMYVCVLIRAYLCVCMHVYICMCIYMGSIYMFMRRVCIHARAPYFNVLRFYII